jgi:hypothetical protein
MPEALTQPAPDQTFQPLELCLAAYARGFQAAAQSGQTRFRCERTGDRAFKNVMPPLTTTQNIADFIACVTGGMLCGAILYREGKQLLSAAHIAHSVVREHVRSHKRKPEPISPSPLPE